MARHRTGLILGTAIALIGSGCAAVGPALQAGAGTAAHNLCSSLFISGLPEEETTRELVGALVGPAKQLVRQRVDRAAMTVDASILWANAKAVYTPGYGCRLMYGAAGETPEAPPLQPLPQIDGVPPAPQVETTNPVLKAALDLAFAETAGRPWRRVKAVVIVKDGRVAAERYAPGFGVDTPVMSFSVAKSVTNALLGILARRGQVNMNGPAPVPEWNTRGDPRGAITLDQLLRMTSGLDAAETGSGFDPAAQMLYASHNMGAYAATRPLGQPPGTVWDYTSVDTAILNRAMGDVVGGGPAGLRGFAEAELFGPIGMRNVTLEFDGAGTFLGFSHLYAPARAFARLGQLYLDDGVAPNGQRILPEGWVAYSRRSTLGSTYGAGFWTNDGPSESAARRIAQGFPKDGFFASGNLGQRVYIVPSEHLVVARFGYSTGPDFDIEGDLRLIAAAISALQTGARIP